MPSRPLVHHSRVRRRARCCVLCAALTAATSVVACAEGRVTIHPPGEHDSIPRSTIPATMAVRPGLPFPEARCALNREAGTITYRTPANYLAAAGVIEVLLAKAKGYFDELCLNVAIVPSFATENYPSVAANDAQFATASSFSELIDFAGHNNAKLVTLAVDGRTPLDALFVRPGGTTRLADFAGAALGAKGALGPAVATMLSRAGLQSKDAKTGELTRTFSIVDIGQAPAAESIARPDLAALNGSLSADGADLAAAGVPVQTVSPGALGVAGSFGVLFTNGRFMLESPTVVEDFLRAASRALRDALNDPTAAVQAVATWIPPLATQPEDVAATMTPFDVDREVRRWNIEANLVRTRLSSGPPNLPLRGLLGAEARGGQAAGLFTRADPNPDALIDDLPLRAVYTAGGTVVWPSAPGGRS